MIAVLIGWIGVTIIAKPEWITKGDGGLPLFQVFIALTGAFLTALAYVCVRKLSKTEHPLVIIYYFPLISIPLSFPLVLRNLIIPRGDEWLWIIAIGLLTQLGQMWITKGLTLIPAAKASAINYVQVLFATAWGSLLFQEPIDIAIILGALFVLIGTMISLSGGDLRERRSY